MQDSCQAATIPQKEPKNSFKTELKRFLIRTLNGTGHKKALAQCQGLVNRIFRRGGDGTGKRLPVTPVPAISVMAPGSGTAGSMKPSTLKFEELLGAVRSLNSPT